MKKIILSCLIMLFSGGALFAQQAQSAQPAQEKTKAAKKEAAHAKAHAVKTATHQKQTTAEVKESSTTATAGLQKEHTDKQYKKHGRHIKKDGGTDKKSPQK